MELVTIGKTTYNKDAICEMSISEFKKRYKGVLGERCESTYYKVTGKKKPSKKKKEDSE